MVNTLSPYPCPPYLPPDPQWPMLESGPQPPAPGLVQVSTRGRVCMLHRVLRGCSLQVLSRARLSLALLRASLCSRAGPHYPVKDRPAPAAYMTKESHSMLRLNSQTSSGIPLALRLALATAVALLRLVCRLSLRRRSSRRRAASLVQERTLPSAWAWTCSGGILALRCGRCGKSGVCV